MTVASIQGHVKAVLETGAADPNTGLLLENLDALLGPGYLPLETGYTRLPNGQMFIAVLTKMPGCTGRMIEWWFGYAGDTEKYRMWHPDAHVVGEWDEHWRPGQYIGASHLVHEYLGAELSKLRITFHEPSEYLDTSKFSKGNPSAVICGRAGFQDKPLDFAHVVHFVRDTEGGCEMRSRFWSGDIRFRLPVIGPALSCLANTPFMRKRLVKEQIGNDLTRHCAEEMNHLAGFLPGLYQQETGLAE